MTPNISTSQGSVPQFSNPIPASTNLERSSSSCLDSCDYVHNLRTAKCLKVMEERVAKATAAMEEVSTTKRF